MISSCICPPIDLISKNQSKCENNSKYYIIAMGCQFVFFSLILHSVDSAGVKYYYISYCSRRYPS